jgi:hypothetical protein
LAFGCALDDSSPVNGAGGAGGSKTTSSSTGSGGKGGAPGTGGIGGAAGPTTTTGVGSTTSTTGVGGAGTTTGGGSDASAGSAGTGGGRDGGGGTPDADGAPGLPDASTCAGYNFNFDGATYGSVRRLVQDSFTLEAWIKTMPSSPTGTQYWAGNGLIYSDLPGQADDFGSSILNDRFAFGIGNPDTTLISTTNVSTGQWFHVAATRDSSSGLIQIFVSGVLEGQQTLANVRPLNAQSFMTIGANTIDSRYFKGSMDEVRIWSVVRTQSELIATMHQRLMGNEPGLVAYWRFDEAGGGAFLDSSQNPLNSAAVIVGTGSWAPSDAPVCAPPSDSGSDAQPQDTGASDVAPGDAAGERAVDSSAEGATDGANEAATDDASSGTAEAASEAGSSDGSGD